MRRQPPDLTRFSEVYIDESSQTRHRYMLLGALVVPTPLSQRLEAALRAARLPELPVGEMKWTKVSRAKLPAYLRFIDEVLHPTRWPTDFHCVIIDTHKLNDNRYNIGSREIGINKEVYQLLLKCWRKRQGRNFQVYLDSREIARDKSQEINSQVTLNKLKEVVNFGVRMRSPEADWPIRRVQFRSSADNVFIQATDLILGAIAFQVNGHHLQPDASPAKVALSQRVLDLGQINDPMKDCSRRATVWWRQLR